MSTTCASTQRLGESRRALQAIKETWHHGRRVLFVLGAGASVAARIPPMWAVYQDLTERAKKSASTWRPRTPDSGLQSRGRGVLKRLAEDLRLLAESKAARSKAAKALGMLQKAHSKRDEVSVEIARIWSEFSKAFVEGHVKLEDVGPTLPTTGYTTDERDSLRKFIQQEFTKDDMPFLGHRVVAAAKRKSNNVAPLPEREPTKLHMLAASMLAHEKALVVSLNFDGLSYRALRRHEKAGALVLSEPTSIREFYVCGRATAQQPAAHSAIIKVWGDVFHAVCRNPQCPQRDHHTPIFNLQEHEKQWTRCPTCKADRQLEIYFTGFEKKEQQTHDTMREFLRFAGPQIGCVVAVGVSGLWDEALVKFIAQIGQNIRREQKVLDDEKRTPAVICVDPKPSALLRHLAVAEVDTVHLAVGAESWADLFEASGLELPERTSPQPDRFDGYLLPDAMWQELVKPSGSLPGSYIYLSNPTANNAHSYLTEFRWLRQLGIKTKVMGMTSPDQQSGGLDEADHNRLMHSIGTMHLASRWGRVLMQKCPRPLPIDEAALEAIVLYAAFHHDVGHIPFTHLAEEVFEEVHWTMHPWSDVFHHDEPVLFNLVELFSRPVNEALNAAGKQLQVDPQRLRFWVESAIQGRLGVPWIDGILNSPLDVDKIDYVFRDCAFLGQGLHFVSDGRGNAEYQRIKRQEEVARFMEATDLLPSGMIAVSGAAGSFARQLLEERRWLYKHQYYRPPMRALERIASAIILRWMLEKVGNGQTEQFFGLTDYSPDGTPLVVTDTSALKGKAAREELWRALSRVNRSAASPGEPSLLMNMIADLRAMAKRTEAYDGMKLFSEWSEAAENLFKEAFAGINRDNLHEEVQKKISFSECCFVAHENLRAVRRIVREIETLRPLRVFFDVAVMPRLLSYPSSRRSKWNQKSVLQECFVVPHKDPDRWHMETDRWVPLSESAFARYDDKRWARLMTVSVFPDDPEVWHAYDVFRSKAGAAGIEIYENDPDGYK